MASPNQQGTAGQSRPSSASISPSTSLPTSSESRESQLSPSNPDPELAPSPFTSSESRSDDHRSTREFVPTGSGAPTHFGTRREHLLRSGSDPSLRTPPHSVPAPFRLLHGGEPASTFAVYRPGPGHTVIHQNPQTGNLVQPQSAEEGDFTESQPSPLRLGRRRAPARSPPPNFPLPTEHELRFASEHLPPPTPPLPPRSENRPNPYHPPSQATPFQPLVRRRAVSYRKNRPLLPSNRRQGNQRITTGPALTPQRTQPTPNQQQLFSPGLRFSFGEENFSSSPISSPPSSAAESPGRLAAEVKTSLESGRESSTRRPSNLFSARAADRTQEPESRETLSSTQDPRQTPEDMDLLHPESAMAMTEHRREAVRMAKSQEAAVVEKCRRSGAAAPGYTFDELIGKGSFGRVYKGRQTSSQKVVAIKVIDIDNADFRAFGDAKDEQIHDFNKEIRILRQAQESGAPNLNQMIEALPVHSQLWLVCEHCPGGSVKTLMRATNDKLGERYIIVVARELSKALKGLHDAGIMHRDIKAANVLIHEEGSLQLCDFGVATVLDKKTDKRRTFIGTLHWMPPELWDRDPEYSDEVDVWAFGCTLYECAVGKPPNSDVREPHQLRSRMRRLNQSIELPENGSYSSALRSLVSYTLTPDAAARPSFSDVLIHECLANTEESHPTVILSELVKVYYSWLYGGGQRASLFMPGGAVAGDTPGSLTTADEDWNFSTTDNFENRMSTVLNIPDFSDLTHDPSLEGGSTPKPPKAAATGDLSAEEKANFEERVRRGADLSNIFDQNKPDYEYVTKTDFIPIQHRRVSDLPLRAMAEERPYSIANQVIDLGDFDSSNYAAVSQAKDEKIKLADAATIKANRSNSKLFSDTTSSETLTAKPSTSTTERPLTTTTETPRPATQDFSFPPKEWSTQEKAAEEGETAEASQPRDPAKHKTMEWSFASAMSEAQEDDAQPSPIAEGEEEPKPNKHDTMQWSFQSAMAEASTADPSTSTSTSTAPQPPPPPQSTRRAPPPLLRSITEPMGSDLSRPSTSYSESSPSATPDEADPFALDTTADHPAAVLSALDERGISSFYGRHRAGVLGVEGEGEAEPEGGLPVEEGGEGEEGEGGEGGEERVKMPAIHGVAARALEGEAPPAALEEELERLLADFQGVLGGAGSAVGVVERRRERERRGRRRGEGERQGQGQGQGGGESEWEDEEEGEE